MLILISEIIVNTGRREPIPADVKALADSISKIGLLNPITVDQEYTLIAGLHRLEAAKLLNWKEIECTVSSLEGIQAELAEIDENFVRKDLSDMEYDDLLLRRKEIYEALHPETRQGKRNGQTSKTDTVSLLETKSFSQDTAEKLGVTPRTVERKVQIAKNLIPEVKEIVDQHGIGFRNALKLSRLAPEQQVDAANQLAKQIIHSMDEYQTALTESEVSIEPEPSLEESPAPRSVPYSLGDKHFATLEESIADLKDPNKDCHYTLDALLADIDGFVDRFHRDFEWYTWPVCTEFFPQLSEVQFEFVQERFGTISTAIKDLLRMMKKELKK